MVIYDPQVVIVRVAPPSPTECVIADNLIEPNNELAEIQDDTIHVVIEEVDTDDVVTQPVDIEAADIDGVETEGVAYYNSFFDLHYTKISYDGNLKENYHLNVEHEYDIEYGFGVPNNVGHIDNGNGSFGNTSDEEGSIDNDFILKERAP
ncbi:hypothetical protein L1887_00962 [Cichorium endivia]|nr:hypothetical protein L1887_00962 [Cichorium endivia]